MNAFYEHHKDTAAGVSPEACIISRFFSVTCRQYAKLFELAA
jgi:hypothetical protein